MSPPHPDPSRPRAEGRVDFALAATLRARLLGAGLVTLGTVVLVGALLAWLTAIPGAVVAGLAVLAVVGMTVLGLLVGVRHWVLRLDEHGYRVRGLRSAQARSARWTDVLDLRATTVSGARVVVLRLRDGRTTTLPVDVLEGGADALTDALSSHLDLGHGYRRLR